MIIFSDEASQWIALFIHCHTKKSILILDNDFKLYLWHRVSLLPLLWLIESIWIKSVSWEYSCIEEYFIGFLDITSCTPTKTTWSKYSCTSKNQNLLFIKIKHLRHIKTKYNQTNLENEVVSIFKWILLFYFSKIVD